MVRISEVSMAGKTSAGQKESQIKVINCPLFLHKVLSKTGPFLDLFILFLFFRAFIYTLRFPLKEKVSKYSSWGRAG